MPDVAKVCTQPKYMVYMCYETIMQVAYSRDQQRQSQSDILLLQHNALQGATRRLRNFIVSSCIARAVACITEPVSEDGETASSCPDESGYRR